MDFFKYRNKLKAEKGRLLISEPYLPDPNFERTIILLCENNEEGSFGFVLNKPSLANVSQVMLDFLGGGFTSVGKRYGQSLWSGNAGGQGFLYSCSAEAAAASTAVIRRK